MLTYLVKAGFFGLSFIFPSIHRRGPYEREFNGY